MLERATKYADWRKVPRHLRAIVLSATRPLVERDIAATERAEAAYSDRFPLISLSGGEKLTIKLAVCFVVAAAALLILTTGLIGVLIAPPIICGIWWLLSLLDRPSFEAHETA